MEQTKELNISNQIIGGISFILGFTLLNNNSSFIPDSISTLLGIVLIYVGFVFSSYNLSKKKKRIISVLALIAGLISGLIAYNVI